MVQQIALPRGGVADLQREGELLTIKLPYAGAYGMGERFDALNQKGRRVVNRVEEKFCFQGEHTYCPAPFFWTDTGFGLYVKTDRETIFDFRAESILVSCPAEAEVVLFTGTPEEIIRAYQAIFGPAKLPPEWAFAPWISANHWSSQADVEEQIALLKKHDFPASVLVVEAWSDEATFYIWNGAEYKAAPDGQPLRYEDFDFSHSPWPDPAGMIQKLHDAGLHLVLWQIPVYKKQGKDEVQNAQNDLDRADAEARGLCVKHADGTPYTIPAGDWFGGSMVPDFTNPETVKSWFAKRQYLLDIGVDGFKTDGGECIHAPGVLFHDATTGLEGENRYPQDYLAAYTKFVGEGGVLFSRAGYAGQHTTPIHWAGDQQSRNSELKGALTAGLSAAMTGIPFWGFDIGGFAGPLPTPDLYRRATQLACFCPIMQWHSEPDGGQFRDLMPGGEGNNERSPWNMARLAGDGYLDEIRFWHKLRMKLLPYLYRTAQDCVATGRPMMRPLVYDWPDDPNAIAIEDEFLLGDALLVAPVLEENAATRRVYLPEGEWVRFFTHERVRGGQWIDADCGEYIPVYRRIEGIIFDLDGVLCHTDRYHYLAWKALADRLGLPFDEEANHRLRGISRMESLEIVLSLGDRAYTDAEKAAMAEEKNAAYRAFLQKMGPEDLADGAVETLKALRAQGLRLAVGSSSKNAPLILERTGIGPFFDAVVDGNQIENSKPHPEVFLRAARELGLRPACCLVVEDAPAGIQAAGAGGFSTAGLGLAAPGSDYPIDHLRALVSFKTVRS